MPASSPAPTQPTVVLPSIHEMFPEHLFPHHHHRVGSTSPASFRSGRAIPSPSPSLSSRSSILPFTILKPDPRATRLQRPVPDLPAASRYSPDGDAEVEFEGDNDNDGDNEEQEQEDYVEGGGGARKHVCHTCGKRFNRPSSLKIHVNTHTGAMPFRCPYPNCNRAFNVNSNMRRHYRNHATTVHGGATTYSYTYPSSTALVATFPVCADREWPPSPSTPISRWRIGSSSTSPSPTTPDSPLFGSHDIPRGPRTNLKRYSESDVRSERP